MTLSTTHPWKLQRFAELCDGDAHIVCRIRLESVEASGGSRIFARGCGSWSQVAEGVSGWGHHGECGARAYNGGLGAKPPAGSRGTAPGQGVREAKPP